MSETPKFTVVDRRKFKAEEEQEAAQKPSPEAAAAPAPAPDPVPSSGPRLVESAAEPQAAEPEELLGELPLEPTPQQSSEQKRAYDASAQRLEDMVRAQNPAMGAPEAIGFEHLVQQFYVTAMIQMGAAAQEGQRPRVDILGARQTIDLLALLADKTRGNLTENENRLLQTSLYEARMAFLELTRMITLQGLQPPPVPPPGKR
jgi:hypothetical protein